MQIVVSALFLNGTKSRSANGHSRIETTKEIDDFGILLSRNNHDPAIGNTMNLRDGFGSFKTFLFRLFLKSRTALWKTKCDVFSCTELNAIQEIVLINLDRHEQRLKDIYRELSQVLTSNGRPLTDLMTRFSALDAKKRDFDYTTLDLDCLLYTSPSPRDGLLSRMPSSA